MARNISNVLAKRCPKWTPRVSVVLAIFWYYEYIQYNAPPSFVSPNFANFGNYLSWERVRKSPKGDDDPEEAGGRLGGIAGPCSIAQAAGASGYTRNKQLDMIPVTQVAARSLVYHLPYSPP